MNLTVAKRSSIPSIDLIVYVIKLFYEIVEPNHDQSQCHYSHL